MNTLSRTDKMVVVRALLGQMHCQLDGGFEVSDSQLARAKGIQDRLLVVHGRISRNGLMPNTGVFDTLLSIAENVQAQLESETADLAKEAASCKSN
jgi:hypothetical protein